MRSPKAKAANVRIGIETTSWYSMVFSADTRLSALALMVSVVPAQASAAARSMTSPTT